MRAGRLGASPSLLATMTLAAVVAAGSCAPKNNGTLLVLTVNSDLRVPDDIDEIEVEVVPDRGDSRTESFSPASSGLPFTLALRPRGAPELGLLVTARGLLKKTPVVVQTAAVMFVSGESRQFQLFLSRDCRDKMCGGETSCVRGGQCVPKAEVAAVAPYPGDVPDAGAGVDPDGATPGDSPRPSDGSVTPPPDVRPPDGPAPSLDMILAPDMQRRDTAPRGTWSLVMAPDVPVLATLNSVFPIAANEVWAVGNLGATGIAFHFDGTTWQRVMLPPATPSLYGVWASAANDVWVVGLGGQVLRKQDGPLFVRQMGSTAAGLTSIWGFGPGDIWWVGRGGAMVHLVGNVPMIVPSGVTTDLLSVHGARADDVWVVGTGGTILRGSGAKAFERQAPTVTANVLFSVWALSPTDVWAAGDRVGVHFNGTAWAVRPVALETTLSVWGVAVDDVWAVGGAGPMIGPVTHYDGAAWMNVASPRGMGLQSVRGLAANDIWAVGNGGMILRYR